MRIRQVCDLAISHEQCLRLTFGSVVDEAWVICHTHYSTRWATKVEMAELGSARSVIVCFPFVQQPLWRVFEHAHARWSGSLDASSPPPESDMHCWLLRLRWDFEGEGGCVAQGASGCVKRRSIQHVAAPAAPARCKFLCFRVPT
eukprot:6824319-Alexandrium_andersonii.AAC.1